MNKVRLNTIVALNAPKKAEVKKLETTYYHIMQKPDIFGGLEKTYSPLDEQGDKLPSESKKVQYKVADILEEIKQPWIDMFDIVLTNDVGNGEAKADVVVDDVVILQQAPVSTLLFLEKQLDNFKAIIDKVPVLSLTNEWKKNLDSGLYETPVVEKFRTSKMEVPLVLYDATKEHPAQTKTIVKDVNVGIWKERLLSSAYPMTQVETMKKRLSKLKDAVIRARETANALEVDQKKGGDKIINYLFD